MVPRGVTSHGVTNHVVFPSPPTLPCTLVPKATSKQRKAEPGILLLQVQGPMPGMSFREEDKE